MNEEFDIFRDSPIRLLGYANEVGESLRPLVHRNIVLLSYGIANCYCLSDVYSKSSKDYKKNKDLKRATTLAGDVFLWQILASVAIPGFTINRITWLTGRMMRQMKIKKEFKKYLPTAFGLASIPLIIKPIDHLVDQLLDNTYRKFFNSIFTYKD